MKNDITISKVNIQDQIAELDAKFWAFYWAIPIFLLIPLGLIYWLWPTSHLFIYCGYGVYLLYTALRYYVLKFRIKKDFRSGRAIQYEGLIAHAELLGKPNKRCSKKEVIVRVGRGSEQKDVVLWQNRRRLFLEQDATLRYRLDELIGKHLQFVELPESGIIISYTLVDTQGYSLKNWGMTYLTLSSAQVTSTTSKGKNQSLQKEKVDFIHLEKSQDDTYHIVKLSSQSEAVFLEIPSFLPNFSALEAWMETLPGFDLNHYQQLKKERSSDLSPLVYERAEKAGIPQPIRLKNMIFNYQDGQLSTVNPHGLTDAIDEKDIDIISVRSNADNILTDIDYEITLHGFTVTSVTVASKADNFAILLHFLYQLPNFDRNRFLATLPKLTESSSVIWQAKPNADAIIKPSTSNTKGALQELEQGIAIENRNTTIFWKDYRSLAQSGITKLQKEDCPNPDYQYLCYHINDAVILNGLKLPTLAFTSPPIKIWESLNLDWPLTIAYSVLSFGLEGTENYQKLKQHLTEVFGITPKLEEGETSLEASWSYGRLNVQIQAWAAQETEIFYNQCQLLIGYDPDVSHFFEDAYVNNLIISAQIQYQIFEGGIDIPADYKDNRFVRKTPEALLSLLDGETKCIVWIDQNKELIGIGNQQYSHIQSLKNHKGLLFVGNYWRDHPTDMSLYFNEKKNQIASGSDNYIGRFTFSKEWDLLIEKIKAFVPMDCDFVEDRQYY